MIDRLYNKTPLTYIHAFRMSKKKVEYNFVMEEEMRGFYSQNLTFSQIVNICFEVNAIYVADSNCGMELRFFLTFIKRVFGFTTAETIEHISDAILHEEDGVNVVTSASTEWLSVSTAGGGGSTAFLSMKIACEAIAALYRKRQPGSPTVVHHTRSLYNFINVKQDAKHDPADEPDIEAMRLLRLAELRRLLVFPWRLCLEEEERLYQPFELSEKKRRWVSHLKFFGYYEKKVVSEAKDVTK